MLKQILQEVSEANDKFATGDIKEWFVDARISEDFDFDDFYDENPDAEDEDLPEEAYEFSLSVYMKNEPSEDVIENYEDLEFDYEESDKAFHNWEIYTKKELWSLVKKMKLPKNKQSWNTLQDYNVYKEVFGTK